MRVARATIRMAVVVVVVTAVPFAGFDARAATLGVAEDDQSEPAGAQAPSQDAASVGAFLPFSQPGSQGRQRAYAVALGGYDSARRTGSFETSTEMRLWGPLAVRGGAVFKTADRSLRPSVGARVQFLRQDHQGIDGAFGVFYRPEGLTEPEGEIESVLSLGHRAGRTYLLGNLLYGQDPEGNERDGEVRLAVLTPVRSYLSAGFDARLRVDLGSQAAKLAQRHEATMDVLAGPTLLALLGPIAVSVQGGPSSARVQGHTSFGAFVMTGLGTAF